LRLTGDPAQQSDLFQILKRAYGGLPAYKLQSFNIVSLSKADPSADTHQQLGEKLLTRRGRTLVPTDVGQMYTYPDFSVRFIWNFADPDFNYPDPRIYGARLLLYGASETKIVNGTMSGIIRGTVATTLDYNAQCYGSHHFTMISTGR